MTAQPPAPPGGHATGPCRQPPAAPYPRRDTAVSLKPMAHEVTGIDHVQLAAPGGCEIQAREFFGRLLGLPEIKKPEPLQDRGGVWFRVGAQELHIGVQEPFAPALKAHPALSVAADRLDSLAERLATGGAKVTWDESLPDVRRFFTEDPWGNRIELLAAE